MSEPALLKSQLLLSCESLAGGLGSAPDYAAYLSLPSSSAFSGVSSQIKSEPNDVCTGFAIYIQMKCDLALESDRW